MKDVQKSHKTNPQRGGARAWRSAVAAQTLRGMMVGAGLVAVAAPTVSHAFIDERSPAPVIPPATLTPSAAPAVAVIPPASAPVIPIPAAPPAQIPTAIPFEYGIKGDLSSPAWSQAYPGPYGEMPVADALIAQIVPIVGQAINLSGPPELLERRVTISRGMSRRQTLDAMANSARLGIVVQGTQVSLASPLTPTPATAPLATHISPDAQPLTPTVLKVTKTWDIAPGTMLSTAMVDWANQWGWKVFWKAGIDYRIAAPIHLTGDFLDTVGEVLDAYKNADRPLWGDWKDDAQEKILVVREPSNRDSDPRGPNVPGVQPGAQP